MTTVLEMMGKRMGDAIGAKRDWDLFWYTHHYMITYPSACIRCGKEYHRLGWLKRHYKKTGHWKEEHPFHQFATSQGIQEHP